VASGGVIHGDDLRAETWLGLITCAPRDEVDLSGVQFGGKVGQRLGGGRGEERPPHAMEPRCTAKQVVAEHRLVLGCCGLPDSGEDGGEGSGKQEGSEGCCGVAVPSSGESEREPDQCGE
jgi:hypothetical protein